MAKRTPKYTTAVDPLRHFTKAGEDLDFEIAFYERLLADKPDFVEALVSLGNAYTRKGLFDKGMAIDLQLIRLRPEEPLAWYNLACSYSLLQRLGESLDALTQALRHGYDDVDHLRRDPDLKNLRQTKEFQAFLAKLPQRARPV
ncbi:MAG: hypothetical protein HY597_06460 [Candidatus Omnitrophica bacterium]|nr:hypothetical protein [Candidatus Omnitrophota bacterium]